MAGRPVLVAAGLHWDEFEGHPGIFIFSPEAASVVRAIEEYEGLSNITYTRACAAAFKLAERFHVDGALCKIEALCMRVTHNARYRRTLRTED
jgi:hypothetical protein